MKPKAALKSRNTKVFARASRPATSFQPSSFASAALRSSVVSLDAMPASYSPSWASGRQRIGGFHNVRSAPHRVARREQHEAADLKRRRAERRARRQIVGDLAARRVAQARQRHVWSELAALGLE